MKTVLVTGGGRGIGAAMAAVFAQNDFNVVISSRTASELLSVHGRLEAEQKGRVLAVSGDVAKEDFVVNLFHQAKARFGQVDILINNAAILGMKDFKSLTVREWDDVMAINVRGVFLCCREFFRQFESNDSSQQRLIINVSSLGGIQHTDKFPGLTAYVTSKFGVTGLTESLAVEGRNLGIDVIGIAPGAVDTEMLRTAAPHFKAGATPMDIAEFVYSLVNLKASDMVSGAMIRLDTNR